MSEPQITLIKMVFADFLKIILISQISVISGSDKKTRANNFSPIKTKIQRNKSRVFYFFKATNGFPNGSKVLPKC